MTLLIFLSFIIYTLLISLRPHWGIYIILLLLPTYQVRFNMPAFPTTYLEWLILILAAVIFTRLIVNQKYRKTIIARLLTITKQSYWLIIFIFLFLLASGIAIFTSPQTIKALGLFKAYFFEGFLFWILFILLIDNREKLFNSLKTLGVLIIFLSVFGIYQFFTLYHLPPSWWGPGTEPRRIVSFYTYPNAVALLITPILAIYSALLIFWDKLVFPPLQGGVKRDLVFSKKFLIIVTLLGIILLMLTFSRGAWIGYVVAILFLSLFSKFKKPIIALLLIGIVGTLIIPTSRDRLAPLFTGADPASHERIKLYKGTWEIIKENPMIGVGLYGFREAYAEIRESSTDEVLNYPHNFFLNFWVETGLLGVLSVVLILVWIFWKGIKLYKENSETQPLILALFAGIIVLFVHGQVDAPFFKNDLAILFWFLVGIVPILKTFSNKMLRN